MRVEFTNRYNELIVFTLAGPNQFLMQGGTYIRMGWDSEEDRLANKFTFADPSGGPYVSNGMTMGYIHPQLVSMIVHYLSWAKPEDKNSNDILIHLYPERIVKAFVNKQEVFRIYSGTGNLVETLPNFNDAVKWIEEKYERR